MGHYRHTVVAEISRDEFEAQRAENVRNDSFAGNVSTSGNVVKPGEFESAEVPGFEPKHYYRMNVEFSRGDL